MKKVLIITYYWPPAGGIGVQRWLQFSKNLSTYGWTPIIYTAKDAKYPIIDEKLLGQIPENTEVHRVKVPEPNNFLSWLQLGKKKNKKLYNLQQQSNVNTSLIKKILWTIRGNFFIPDSRKFWIGKSVRYLDSYISQNPVDAIVSTGPPHSTHLIAQRIKEKHGLTWVADFRDPWTSMDYLQRMNLSSFARVKHKKLEEEVLRKSTHISVVGKAIQTEFKDNYAIDSTIIHNGFSNDYPAVGDVLLDEKFTVVHTGSFLHYRNCNDFWQALSELVRENEHFSRDLEIKLVGNIAPIVQESIKEYGLEKHLNHIQQVDHFTAKSIQRSAQLLLLPIDRIENAEFVITGKLFEYLQAQRPIFLIGPEKGDAADIIVSCSAGDVVEFENIKKMKEEITKRYNAYLAGNNYLNSVNIEQYSYRELTGKLVALLEKPAHS